jgi:hypothetical protein
LRSRVIPQQKVEEGLNESLAFEADGRKYRFQTVTYRSVTTSEQKRDGIEKSTAPLKKLFEKCGRL